MKAELKKKEEVKVLGGMSAKDLSIEKRQELFQAAYNKFEAEMKETLGLGIGCEILYTPRAAVPRLTLVDLLPKKENVPQGNQENPKA